MNLKLSPEKIIDIIVRSVNIIEKTDTGKYKIKFEPVKCNAVFNYQYPTDFSLEDDLILLELFEKEFSAVKIATKLNRHVQDIKRRLKELGKADESDKNH